MKLLVTGAFGYVGLTLLGRLAGAHRIVAFGHAPRNPAARELVPAAVESIEGEILDVAPVVARVRPEVIVHLSGGGGPARADADPVAAVRSNVRGATELAAAARAAGVRRIVYASSIAVYGTFRDHGAPYRESDVPRPDEMYGTVKEAAEHALVALGGAVALRIANVYGAGTGVDLGAGGAADRFARAAASGGTMILYGGGAQKIDWVHVDDVCEAIALAIEAAEPPQAINIGGGEPISLAALAERFAAAGARLGARTMIEHREAPPGKVWPDRSLDISLAASALGWRPRVSLEQGIDEMVLSFKRRTT